MFKSLPTVALALSAIVSGVSASPRQGSKRATAPTDVQILNYALTLEHLENAFYSGALAKFDNATFSAANADRGRFEQIAAQEAEHVAFLSKALGTSATAACNYSFPYTDLVSFVALASVLESVGVSAYLGAAQYISNKDYLTAAAAILTTESRHQAYIAYVSNQAPWSGPFDTPEALSNIYSLAAPFITSCPSSNPTLPVVAFPTLNTTSTNVTSGSPLKLAFTPTNSTSNSTAMFVAFYSGLTSTFVPLDKSSMTVTVPANLTGTVYAVVTSSNTSVTDATTIAGPIILATGGLTVAGNDTNGTITGTGSNSSSSGGSGGSGGGSGSGGSGGSSAGFLNAKAGMGAMFGGLMTLVGLVAVGL